MVTALFPFRPHDVDIAGLRMRYVDEGAGHPVVMVHGNPTWSFYYRNLIQAVRDGYRAIAPDHIGMGYSEKPTEEQYDFTLRRRVDDFGAFMDALGLQEPVTLVVHDWGGMIGMAWAARHPERIARLVVLNTAAFPMPADKRFPPALTLTRTRLGAFLALRLNAFSRGAARFCVTRRPLPSEVRAAYLAPYDTPEHRVSVLRFVQDIPLAETHPAYAIVRETAEHLDRLSDVPMLLCWGEKDFVFDAPFLAEWMRRFPKALVQRYPDAGHYLLEDAPECIARIRAFLDETASSPAREMAV